MIHLLPHYSSASNFGFFISLMLMLLLLPSSSYSSFVEAAVVCPPSTAYTPCICKEYSNKPGTIELNCSGGNLNNTQMSDILDAFLVTTPGISPVASLSLQVNQLTRVPSQIIKLFNHLVDVWLNSNAITSIESGTFNFTDAANPVQYLVLYENQLTTIAPGAFKG